MVARVPQVALGTLSIRLRNCSRASRALTGLAVAALVGQCLAYLPAQAQAVELNPSIQARVLPDDPGERLLILVAGLTGDGTPAERKRAVIDILSMEGEDPVKVLSGILNLKNNGSAKLAICEALAEVEKIPSELADPLFGLLAQQNEQVLRDAAVTALYRFSDPRVSQRLRDFLEQEELQWLRSENVARSRELYSLLPRESDRIARLQTWLKAAQPLDRLTALEIVHSAMLATTPVPPAKEVLQQIRQMLRDPDENVRRKLVVVLRDLQEKEDAPRIAGMLETERSPLVLEEIYKALGRMGSAESIPACVLGLQSPDHRVAAGAADALGRLCRKANGTNAAPLAEVVAAFLKKTAAPIDDPLLRGQVISAMAAIADAKFLPALLAHAGSTEQVPQIRQAALNGIGEIGDASNLELVVARLTEDSDAGVREAAAQALGKLGNKPLHLRPLVIALADASAAVQSRAWTAYRQIFARLSWNERLEVLATWAATDKANMLRRVDLLTDLESQATTAKREAAELIRIREDLGDTLLGVAEYSLAAAAYARALESVTSEQSASRLAISPKLLGAYLQVPAYDKAATLAAGVSSPDLLAALSQRLLAHVEERVSTDSRAVADCLERFQKTAPAVINSELAASFAKVRQAASQPAASAPAGS